MTKPTKWQAGSKESDQLGHPPSLIRVFAVRMKKAWVLSYPLSAQRRLWSDWADVQADLSLRWAHSHFVGIVIFVNYQTLEACMKHCGRRFHQEVGKFRFLNEIIKVISPKVGNVMILSFWTAKSVDPDQTASEGAVCPVCHSVCIFWTYCWMVKNTLFKFLCVSEFLGFSWCIVHLYIMYWVIDVASFSFGLQPPVVVFFSPCLVTFSSRQSFGKALLWGYKLWKIHCTSSKFLWCRPARAVGSMSDL